MRVAVAKEDFPGERRVALVPSAMSTLTKAGFEIAVESGAGAEAGYPDSAYRQAGAEIVQSFQSLLDSAEVIVRVRPLGGESGGRLDVLRKGQTVIGLMDPLSYPEPISMAAGRGLNLFALELMPRITRAQSMDVLSSQASLAGYKAVILAANELPRIFPLMMTAAGTVTPARVLVLGAGVAGLQAIATAKRLGAVVSAYDVRPVVKEQVESLGARFLSVPLEPEAGEEAGGYARAMDEAFYRRQAELMAGAVAESDVVITTAAVPGEKAPVLITAGMVEAMAPGSVIVDMSAERGGNCELTRAGETVAHSGVKVMGPLNLPSTVAYHASQVFARNAATFLTHIAKDGKIPADPEDEITKATLVAFNGEVVNARVRERLGMPPLAAPPVQIEEAAAVGEPVS